MRSDILEIEKQIREADMKALVAYKSGKADAPTLYKPTGFFKSVSEDKTMTFVASEESPDRMGDVVSAAGWQLDEFKKNPVYMYSHNYGMPPVGIVPKVWIDGKQLLNVVKWDEEDEFARQIEGKFKRGIMKAESVGFRVLDFKELDRGVQFLKQELLEISAVAVPAHPHALIRAMMAMGAAPVYSIPPEVKPKRKRIEKSVISWADAHPDGTPKAAPDAEWDAAAEVAKATPEDLMAMCAWVDKENPENKTSYKFPHHMAEGEHAVVKQACGAAMSVINGGRGGADIPDADKAGVYAHIAQHMKDDFEMEPPPMRSAKAADMADMKSMMEECMGHMSECVDIMQGMMDMMDGDGAGELTPPEEPSKRLAPAEATRLHEAIARLKEV